MKLKIGAKVNLLVVLALILVGGVSLFFSISALKGEGELAVQQYSTDMMKEKRFQIRDLVNSAFTIAKERLDASMDKDAI
ncbi:MAG: hypothetical protein HUK40_06400 [Desulfobacter sp.]|nr:hypothetical protein [Desulfobacter sp.]